MQQLCVTLIDEIKIDEFQVPRLKVESNGEYVRFPEKRDPEVRASNSEAPTSDSWTE